MRKRYIVTHNGARAYLVDATDQEIAEYVPPAGHVVALAGAGDETWAQTQPGYAPLMQDSQ